MLTFAIKSRLFRRDSILLRFREVGRDFCMIKIVFFPQHTKLGQPSSKLEARSTQSGRFVPGSWVVQILGCIRRAQQFRAITARTRLSVFGCRSQRAAATTSTTILGHPGAPAPGPAVTTSALSSAETLFFGLTSISI